MNSHLHIHVATENRDLLLICLRTVEEPANIWIESILCDGLPLTQEGIDHYLRYYEATIYGELARKLQIRRNALSIFPISFKDIL